MEYFKGLEFLNEPINDKTDLKLARKQMIVSDYLEDDQIALFQTLVASNIIDRYRDRIRIDSLKSLNETLVGKVRLLNHITSNRTGIVYDSELIELDKKQSLTIIGKTLFVNISKILDEIIEKDGGLFWIKAKYYMPMVFDHEKINVHNVKTALDKFTSIGFSSEYPIAIRDEKEEKILYWEFQNTKERRAESVELSSVYMGAQLGVSTYSAKELTLKIGDHELQTSKYLRESILRQYCFEIDEKIRDKPSEKVKNELYNYRQLIFEADYEFDLKTRQQKIDDITKLFTQKTKGAEKMSEVKRTKLSLDELGIQVTLDENQDWIPVVQREVSTAFKNMLAMKQAAKRLENLEETFGQDLEKVFETNKKQFETIQSMFPGSDAETIRKSIKSMLDTNDKVKQSIITDTIVAGQKCGFIGKESEAIEKEKTFLQSFDIDRLQGFLDHYKQMPAITKAAAPGNGQVPVPDSTKQVDSEKKEDDNADNQPVVIKHVLS